MNESLERLINWFGIPPEVDERALCYKDIDTIEKALEEKEKQDDYIKFLEDRVNNLETSYARVKKTLEIFKKTCKFEFETKIVNKKVKVFRVHINGILTIDLETQEEYDLLKEVLK